MVDCFDRLRAIISRPAAGGVVGYAMTTFQRKTQRPVIGFDIGGMGTDVSRYVEAYEYVFESLTA